MMRQEYFRQDSKQIPPKQERTQTLLSELTCRDHITKDNLGKNK